MLPERSCTVPIDGVQMIEKYDDDEVAVIVFERKHTTLGATSLPTYS